MAAKKWSHHDATGEVELDLTPMLSLMVQLVPILLMSSVFVQMMIIETELPQIVKQAVQQNAANQEQMARIRLSLDQSQGMTITVTQAGKEEETKIPMNQGAFDFQQLHEKLVALKGQHPDVFKIDLTPGAGVEYGDIVRAMDEARRSRDNRITFPVKDAQNQSETQTPFMFPEIVFANSLESGV